MLDNFLSDPALPGGTWRLRPPNESPAFTFGDGPSGEKGPILELKGMGHKAVGVIEDDDIVAHGVAKMDNEMMVPLSELFHSFEYSAS
ncbi:unnamed protein product [Effrenium voratum]|nr:unnamed protein product [Effrenium voratum]